MHVAIVALGPSAVSYWQMAEAHGGRHAFCDETWCINSNGDVFACDRIFHMDDVRVQEARAAAGNTKIGAMLAWMKGHPGPVYTSTAHDDYPGLVAYPLADVINSVGTAYFNSTAAYAVAYAIHLGVKRLSLFGIDFTWPDRHEAEQGRACVEYWLGRAMQRGIEVFTPTTTTLMDANLGRPFYGYDTREPDVRFADGKATVTFRDKDMPDAAEIERRYDHSMKGLSDV